MKKLFFVFPLLAMMFLASCESEPQWEPLFNGEDFAGWEFYLGVPLPFVDVPDMELNEDSVYTQPLGVGNDPLEVFKIVEVDGEPALRISGEIFGSFATVDEFENYHLRLETKWGDTKWVPNMWGGRRNSGLLYHGVGEFGAGLGVWKTSHELQIMENDFGDSYRMGEIFCDITATSIAGRYTFDSSAEPLRFGPGMDAGPICHRSQMAEKPHGEWNVVELICFEGTSIHIVNGKVNMVNTNSHLLVDGNEVALTKGVIQLQSEGAEIFFRNIEIRPIKRIPAQYLNN